MILWGARTHFTVGESILQPARLVELAHQRGYTAVALADTMSLSGIIEASNKGKKLGCKVIVGCTLRVQLPDGTLFLPRLYARTAEGFTSLMRSLSAAGKTPGRNSVSFLTSTEFYTLCASHDFWVSSGDAQGLFSAALSEQQRDSVLDEIGRRVSASLCIAELPLVGTPLFARQLALTTQLAAARGWHSVRSCFALYGDSEEAEARDVMNAIVRNVKVNGPWRRKVFGNKRFVRPVAELNTELRDQLALCQKLGFDFHPGFPRRVKESEEALNTSPEFWAWSKAPLALPKMADDEHKALVELCRANMRDRLMSPVFGYMPDKVLLPKYAERLKLELEVLGKMGFSGYFLMVADIVRWAKKQGIAVGPGRGSVGGSLVAYVVGITDVDPLRFGLLFERFINPERLDLPDADLDFASERRHEVIEYIIDRYGRSKVALISNYNTLAPPSAIREVGRTLDLPVQDYEVSKLVPKEHGSALDLEDARAQVSAIDDYANKYPGPWTVSKALVGTLRSAGTHAAGVVISSVDIDTRAVVEERNTGERVVNWDKRVVEDQGLVKVDILGLSNLDIIRSACDKIERRTGKQLDVLSIPLTDEKTLAAFGRGETVGVFQFESPGMRKLLMQMAKNTPLTFDELAIATALYRPGPLDSGMIEEYLDIRNGYSSPYYEHPAMETAMKETGGVLVYQEQVMALSRELCGFTMAEADNLRKAVGKKDKDKMASIREAFVKGAVEHGGMEESRAGAIWDNIENFGSYGFNKSHSVEYSIISFITMWLKVHHPVAFYAGCLEAMKEERLAPLVADANKRGIELLPPDVNKSGYGFEVESGNKLRIPLSRIKGLSDNAQQAVLEARAYGGPFKSMADFRARVPGRKVNKTHMQVLDEIGAFAEIEPGQLPALHPDRTRAQMERIPGLISRNVIISRPIVWDDFTKEQIRKCVVFQSREISGGIPPMPATGRKPRMMVITDAPNKQEERAGQVMKGDTAEYVKQAMEEAGLTWSKDAYFTTLCKVPKADKRVSAQEVATWLPLLKKEIQIINPPIIVALGSETTRALLPNEKGGIMDLATKVVYSREYDANVVIGINPGMIWIDPSRQEVLNRVFEEVAGLTL